MATGEQCRGVSRAGARCRAWAMRGTTFCVAHGGRRAGEGRAGSRLRSRSEGRLVPVGVELYEPLFSDRELAAVEAVYDQLSVKGEVAAARIVARRLLAQMGEAGAGSGEQLARFGPLVLEALRTVAVLMETEKGLAPKRDDEIMAAIGQALDELGEEWAVEL